MKFKAIILHLFMAGIALTATAVENTTGYIVDFDLESTEIDPGYKVNSLTLNEVVDLLNKVVSTPNYRLVSVAFSGETSLDGPHETNSMIAQKRRDALENYIRSRVVIPESVVTRSQEYINWEWLKEEVTKSDIAQRQEIVSIIDEDGVLVDYYAGKTRDSRIVKLRWIRGGEVWQQLDRRYSEAMRRATVTVVVDELDAEDSLPEVEYAEEDVLPVLNPIQVVEQEPDETESERIVSASSEFDNYCYLKTNLVGWGMGMINAAIEFDVAPHWSVALPVYYSGWNYFSNDLKFRIIDVKPEIRYWPSYLNKGFFVGAHGGASWFNFAFKGEYRYQSHSSSQPALGGGISVGYRLPITRNQRCHVEFSVGAGAYRVKYDKIQNVPDGRLVETLSDTYLGPDQASITISYRFSLSK
ncbi:MAG: DUF3575 domain-containing protein [Muribaculaceae bacterium]|nr:DUF3575 domain-containing protein [Muribaculaceae bacterium]